MSSSPFNLTLASYQDPLKKREEFAVSLRKKKTTEIINAKRRRLIGGTDSQGTESKHSTGVSQHYKGHDRFEKNIDEYNQMLGNLCPEVIQDRTLTIVSLISTNLVRVKECKYC